MVGSAPPMRRLLAFLPLLTGLLIVGCAAKAPLAPPEFYDPGRAPTGDSILEQAITEGIRLEEAGPEEEARLRERVETGIVEEAELGTLVALLTGRGKAAEALQILHRRAIASPMDEGKTGDALGFAMGHYQWQTCADMAKQYLERQLNAAHFMIRALCLERAGNLPGSKENFVAADEVRPLDRAVNRKLIQAAVERGSPGPMPPADDRTYFDLVSDLKKLGPGDRVFAVHLLGRFDGDLQFGTIAIGGTSEGNIRQVVNSRARSYRYCYYMADAVAKVRGKLIGSAQVEWTIGPLGQVQDVKVAESDWGRHPGASAMNQCLVEQVGRLRFPRPRYGYPLPMRHRFVYQPTD